MTKLSLVAGLVLSIPFLPVGAVAQSPGKPSPSSQPTPPPNPDRCASLSLDQRISCRLGEYQFQHELLSFQAEQLQHALEEAQKKVKDLTEAKKASDASPAGTGSSPTGAVPEKK